MKLNIYKFCVFFIFGISISVNALADKTLPASNKIITLAYEEKPNPPFYLGNKTIDWKKPGITLDVLKSLEKNLNVKFKFERLPWARGLELLKNNLIDGVFHASFKKKRLNMGVYPMKNDEPDTNRSLMSQAYFLYKRKGSPLNWDGKTFEHLNGSIGAIIGYAVVEDLKQMNVDVEKVATQWSNLSKLVLGRIGGVAGLESMNDIVIKTNPEKFRSVVKVYPPIIRKPYYLMLSHNFVNENPELAEAIWDGIRNIRLSGEYEQITRKYLDEN